MTIIEDRNKWNAKYKEGAAEARRPGPHALALAWRERFIGGPMLDTACGLGRGIASGMGVFTPVYAVDLSEEAIAQAKSMWQDVPDIHWITGDVNAQVWPLHHFGLICAFGFTDMEFFGRLPELLMPGGMFLYEGFSARQREIKPALNPDWIGDPEAMRALFAEGEILELDETAEPPFRLRMAAVAAQAA